MSVEAPTKPTTESTATTKERKDVGRVAITVGPDGVVLTDSERSKFLAGDNTIKELNNTKV